MVGVAQNGKDREWIGQETAQCNVSISKGTIKRIRFVTIQGESAKVFGRKINQTFFIGVGFLHNAKDLKAVQTFAIQCLENRQGQGLFPTEISSFVTQGAHQKRRKGGRNGVSFEVPYRRPPQRTTNTNRHEPGRRTTKHMLPTCPVWRWIISDPSTTSTSFTVLWVLSISNSTIWVVWAVQHRENL